MITNVDVYFAIAEEALAESERLEKLARRPKPDGEPGVIVTYDPERKSFKNSLYQVSESLTPAADSRIGIYLIHHSKTSRRKPCG
jgi:hypothetical protein